VDEKELYALAKEVNGRRRQRVITPADCREFLEVVAELESDPTAITVRMYPRRDPFVANAYSYRAYVTILEAKRSTGTQPFNITVGTVDAHRPGGAGAHLTVNSRAVR
jgi:hypothetical protein